ncbi:DUF4215 domain-containing protein [Myxococcota bacterium]|nr:DUF4215 domain-containing protein [Myxococcota bacterium]MBU1380027.1 DUF4215 domain-containing protein [Myxococcota bacterium]
MKFRPVVLFAFMTLISVIHGCDNNSALIEGECGNAIINKGEECDNGLGNSNITPDACRTDCQKASCGDGVKDSDEECDGFQLGSMNCSLLGFDMGTLVCSDDCSFDTSGCTTCGNGVLEAGEQCDLNEIDKNCMDLGFSGGSISCLGSCKYDVSGCTGGCGNSIIELEEECDSENLNDLTCPDLGFNGGFITCNSACRLDVSNCIGGCGNGLLENDESCDDGNSEPEDGCYNCTKASGLFLEPVVISTEFVPLDIELRDFDGDGIKDILVAESSVSLGDGRLVLYRWQNNFTPEVISRGHAFYRVVSIKGSNNTTGFCAAAIRNETEQIIHYTYDYTTTANIFSWDNRVVDMHAADFGTGREEILIVNFPEQGIVYFNPETGSHASILALGGVVGRFGFIDYNSDGVLDIAMLRSASQLLSLIQAQAPYQYYYAAGRYVGGRPHDLHIGDIDGDGETDILITDLSNPYLYFFRYLSGDISYIYQLMLPSSPGLIRTLRSNYDSLPDLLMSFPSESNLTLYNGIGALSFTPAQDFSGCPSPSDIEVGDVNGDGLTDIVFSCSGDSSIRIAVSQVE